MERCVLQYLKRGGGFLQKILNLHLKVGRSGLGAKVEHNKISNLKKDQNKTTIASICYNGLREHVFV